MHSKELHRRLRDPEKSLHAFYIELRSSIDGIEGIQLKLDGVADHLKVHELTVVQRELEVLVVETLPDRVGVDLVVDECRAVKNNLTDIQLRALACPRAGRHMVDAIDKHID